MYYKMITSCGSKVERMKDKHWGLWTTYGTRFSPKLDILCHL